MKVALHISDTHFGTERIKVVHALERFAHTQAPDVVILSGDVTQRARAVEFSAAASFLDRLAIPSRLVIAGNHDVPLFDLTSRLFWPYERYKRTFGIDLEPVLDAASLLVIGVRTTRRYRHIEGEVSAKQIHCVAERLRQAEPDQLRVVVTHQPVHVLHAADKEHLLRGHEQAIRLWAEAGVDLILGGHIHRPFMVGLQQIDASLPRPVWVIQAGTAVSSRLRYDANNSFNLIRYACDGRKRHCVVERWDYDEASDEFMMVAREVLQGL